MAADLQSKYQKLASEYAKLRAQIPVLKKAVLDEQTKENHFKEAIKEKEQSIRKFEQEIDSLVFRNQQLTKRVEILQSELVDAEAKDKKSKNKHNDVSLSTSPRSSAIGEELKQKIEENERLHKQVYNSDLEYKQKVADLQDRLTMLEQESAQHQQVLQTTQQNSKVQLEKLQNEKAMLEIKLHEQEKLSKEAKLRAQTAEQQLKMIQTDLTSKLTQATKTIRDKLPFNDTKFRDLNALNVPTHDRKHQLKAKELCGQATNLVQDLVQGLANYYTYVEQRTKIYPADGQIEPYSEVNKKFCQYLHENMQYLRPVEQSFRAFYNSLKEDALTTLETAMGLQEFAHHFTNFVAYSNKIMPYQLLSLEEECSLSSCPEALAAKNKELYSVVQKLSAVLNKIQTYVAVIAQQSTVSCDHPKTNQAIFFEQLSGGLELFHTVLKELSTTYNAKVTLEHQLPTAPSKLKTTDECVMSALVHLQKCAGKFANFMRTNLEFFCATAGYRTRGSSISTNESMEGPKSSPVVGALRQKSANYMASLHRQSPESVPYRVAVENRRTLLSSTESRDSLAQQVTNFQERTKKLEQDKEHWMLESQLMKMKYDKEMQKVAELEKQLARTSTSAGSLEDNMDRGLLPQPQASPQPAMFIETSMLGQLETSKGGLDDQATREELIKKHYMQRIDQLTSQLQMADSKAVQVHAECKALHKRLSLAEKAKVKTQEEIRTANQSVTQLKDELQTTTKNYESQLSTMSDHLAAMNERLMQQQDEIEEYKARLGAKIKKGKTK
ncbi:protein phosphatase 1 regulatory subunit 21 [Lingula anatina]|uniref:Protein phosphatase 1 regulatory subunit 21 n=1 Tax=Lingula anatina TaxID=7574 RepID=A0A1S3JN27_LINAN|nr:protein phosphatase 1 regulatory subunit 21 [Lingula anatina]|eukprot:XP_013411783.1 protein phosphatase 1 regulatory subunit 21 [Lingula anatina]